MIRILVKNKELKRLYQLKLNKLSDMRLKQIMSKNNKKNQQLGFSKLSKKNTINQRSNSVFFKPFMITKMSEK